MRTQIATRGSFPKSVKISLAILSILQQDNTCNNSCNNRSYVILMKTTQPTCLVSHHRGSGQIPDLLHNVLGCRMRPNHTPRRCPLSTKNHSCPSRIYFQWMRSVTYLDECVRGHSFYNVSDVIFLVNWTRRNKRSTRILDSREITDRLRLL